MSAGLVIIGGSYAGVQIAASAREAGYGEPIRLISDDSSPPYQRPPLSKGFLAGKAEAPDLLLRAEAFYRDNRIEIELEQRALRIDLAAKCIETAAGAHIAYDRLALALGSRARRLPVPGGELDGVLTLRSLEDARRLRERMAESRSTVVVGGGFIGLEVASILAPLGKEVTVVEAEERLLARVAAPPLADFIAAFHRKKGVRLLFRQTVREIRGEGGRVRQVICADGTALSADLVIIGIGAVPDCAIAEAAGLPCRDGILVDAETRTADPAVVAAGDCTSHPSRFAGARLRLESVQNALDQGRVAGALVAGRPATHDAVPWFWSDQYELKLQMAGLSRGHDRVVIRGAPDDARFSAFYFRGGRLIAVDAVNRPAEYMLGRKIIGAALPLTPEEAQDPHFDLRATAARRPAA